MNNVIRQPLMCLSKVMLITLLSMAWLPAHAGCLDQARLTGVNLAGAEFNGRALPGVVFRDYTYPSAAELQFIAEQGANMIRLPFLWERLQPALNQPFDATELGHIKLTVKRAQEQGLCVLLDVHNYASYRGYTLDETLPDGTDLTAAYIAFWLALAAEFNDPTLTAFGLMNEPAKIPLLQWAAIAKQTLAALRAAEVSNLVFVSGGHWSGLQDWFAGAPNSNANVFEDLHDPLKRAVIEVHQYTDSNYSGTHTATTGTGCRAAEEFTDKFERISSWANTHQQTLFLGEFGVPASSECLATLTRFLEMMNSQAWLGWSYWAAGGWWGNYPLALSGPDKPLAPQWGPLQLFFYDAKKAEAISPPEAPLTDPLTKPTTEPTTEPNF